MTQTRPFRPPSPLPNSCNSFMFWTGFGGPGRSDTDTARFGTFLPFPSDATNVSPHQKPTSNSCLTGVSH